MPIHWTNADNHQWTTHEGLVLGRMTRCNRVMSDIYADEYYALVWDPDTATSKQVKVGSSFELYGGPWGTVTVDATPEVCQHHKDAQEAQARAKARADKARRAKENTQRRLEEHHRPTKGKVMQVVKGRKVSPGTIGEVFWVRDGRVGLTLDGSKDAQGRHNNVVWVDASYLVNVEPLDQDTPVEAIPPF